MWINWWVDEEQRMNWNRDIWWPSEWQSVSVPTATTAVEE